MSKSKIEWTDETWNPITGCEPVSEGCENCYAHRMAKRLAGRFGYPKDEPFRPGVLHKDKLAAPQHWDKPRKVFVCSMGDLFHSAVSFWDIVKVFRAMRSAEQHIFQILTKRPARMLEFVEWTRDKDLYCWPLSNVWVGVTAESQERADERIPKLLQIPAAVRFVSCEPLLGPVNIWKYVTKNLSNPSGPPGRALTDEEKAERWGKPSLDWIICGGESGPGARPTHPDWVRSLRDQCQAADVPFIFKQWGKFADHTEKHGNSESCTATHDLVITPQGHIIGAGAKGYGGGVEDDWRERGAAWMCATGKKKAGRELDGETWDQFPDAVEGGE